MASRLRLSRDQMSSMLKPVLCGREAFTLQSDQSGNITTMTLHQKTHEHLCFLQALQLDELHLVLEVSHVLTGEAHHRFWKVCQELR